MSLQIRKARPSDIDALAAIETAAFPGDRLSGRSFRRLVASPSADMQVAVADAGVAGYVLVLFRKGTPDARLYSLAVAPGVRGAGRKLLDAAEAAADRRGALGLRLEVRADNARAIALYERNGYGCAGEVDGYYEDGCAARRYRKALHPELSRGAPPGRLPQASAARH